MQDVAGAYWASTGGLTVAGTYNLSCLVGRDALASSAGSAASQMTVVAGAVAPGNTRCCLLAWSTLQGAGSGVKVEVWGQTLYVLHLQPPIEQLVGCMAMYPTIACSAGMLCMEHV